jgi:predicted transcriptional regulator
MKCIPAWADDPGRVKRETNLKLSEVADLLQCEVVAGERDLGLGVDEICAADLMSDVLAFTTPGALLLTGLTNLQSVITAHVAEVRAIIYVRGKKPDVDAVKLADQKGIPLLASPLSMFAACGRLFEKGLRSGSDLSKR